MLAALNVFYMIFRPRLGHGNTSFLMNLNLYGIQFGKKINNPREDKVKLWRYR